MIITIDTNKDSKDDILKAIEFLKSFIQSSSQGSLVNKNNSTAEPKDFFDLSSMPNASNLTMESEKEPNEKQNKNNDDLDRVIPY